MFIFLDVAIKLTEIYHVYIHNLLKGGSSCWMEWHTPVPATQQAKAGESQVQGQAR